MPSAQSPEYFGVTRVVGPDGGSVPVFEGLSIPAHDYIALTYTGSNLTGVTYKIGGSSGTTVATLVLTYDGNDNLLTVTRS